MSDKTQVAELSGRELDAAVAEEVMGRCVHQWEETPEAVRIREARSDFEEEFGEPPPEGWSGDVYSDEWLGCWDYTCSKCETRKRGGPHGMPPVSGYTPSYSTDIAAAWKVVKHIKATTHFNVLVSCPTVMSKPGYEWDCVFTAAIPENNRPGSGATAPEAICRAALKAVRRA